MVRQRGGVVVVGWADDKPRVNSDTQRIRRDICWENFYCTKLLLRLT
jgi:hypothetical protein